MTNNQLSTQQAKRDIAIDTSVWTFQDVKRYFDPQIVKGENNELSL